MEKEKRTNQSPQFHCGLRLTVMNLTHRIGGRTTFAVYLQSFSCNLDQNVYWGVTTEQEELARKHWCEHLARKSHASCDGRRGPRGGIEWCQVKTQLSQLWDARRRKGEEWGQTTSPTLPIHSMIPDALQVLSNYAPLYQNNPSSPKTTARKDISSSSLARLTLTVKMSFSTFSQFQHSAVPAPGQALRALCCGWGPPGPQWKRLPGTSFSWLGVEESRWMWMSENRHAANTRQRADQRGANPIQRTADGKRRRYMDALCRWRGKMKWRSERTVSFQKQDRGIYINFLL